MQSRAKPDPKIAKFEFLKTACEQFLRDHENDKIDEVFGHVDHHEFINALKGMLSTEDLNYDKLVRKFKRLFRQRWNFIRNTHTSYEVRETHVNAFCYQIATFIDNDYKMALLMPTLKGMTSQDLNALQFGWFIVSENGKGVIDVGPLLHGSLTQKEERKYNSSLTSNERMRLYALSTCVEGRVNSFQQNAERGFYLSDMNHLYLDTQPIEEKFYLNLKASEIILDRRRNLNLHRRKVFENFHDVKYDILHASVAKRLALRKEPLKDLYLAYSNFGLKELHRIELKDGAMESNRYQIYLQLADILGDEIGIRNQNNPLSLDALREVDKILTELFEIEASKSNMVMFSSDKAKRYTKFIEKNRALVDASGLRQQVAAEKDEAVASVEESSRQRISNG